jgi:hypothetical protein
MTLTPRRRHLGTFEPLSGFDAIHLDAVGVAGQLAEAAAEDEQEISLLEQREQKIELFGEREI